MNVQAGAQSGEPHTPTDPQASENATNLTTPADSSPAPDGDNAAAKTEPKAEDKTFQDVTRNVLDESRKKLAKADTASPPDAEAKQDKPADGKAKVEPAKADPKAEPEPPFHKHPRWIDLNSKLKTAKEQLAAIEPQLAELKPLAEVGKSVHQFMTENHLSEDEFKYGQHIMALMKHAPGDALKAIDELRVSLQIHLGQALPADLQERVDAGEISEVAAKELLKAKLAGETAQAKADRLEAQRKSDAQVQASNAVTEATNKWWTDMKAKDPDLGKIDQMVVDRLTSLVTAHRSTSKEGISPEKATELCQKAYDDVKAKLKSLTPPKPQVTPLRSEPSKQGTAQAGMAPKDMLGVTKAVLARTRGGA